MNSTNDQTTRPIFRARQAIWFFLAVLEILLIFRFFLKLLGANANAGFTNFIYDFTSFFMAPFLTVFRIRYETNGSLNWSILLAMFVYWLIAAAFLRFLFMSKPISTNEAGRRLDELNKY